MVLLRIHRSYAFFQCQKRSIDFCALQPPLPIIRLRILRPLTPSQIHENQLPLKVIVLIFQSHITDRMRPTGRIIALCLMSRPGVMPKLDNLVHIFRGVNLMLGQAWDLESMSRSS